MTPARAKLSPLVWYAGLYAGAAAALKFLGFVLFMWLARSLSVEDYARFGLLYALQTGLATVAIAGVVEVVIGLLRDHPEDGSRRALFVAANSYFALTALPAGLCALFAMALVKHAATAALVALAAAIVVGVLSAFASLQAQMTRLGEAHRASLTFNFIAPLSALLGGGIGFLAQRSVGAFFFGSALGMLLTLIALRAAGVGEYGLAVRMRELGPIVTRIAPFVVTALLGWLSGYGNNYIVKGMFSSAEVARFTFALNLTSVVQLVATALNQVWSPRFYRTVYKLPPAEVERRNRRFFGLQGWALGLVGAVALAVLPRVMGALKGNLLVYASMQRELLLLFLSYVVLSPWWHCSNYYLVHGRGRELMRISVVSSAIGIAAWVALMWFLGPIGIYWGFLTQMCVRTAMIVVAAKREWPLRIAWGGVAAGTVITCAGLLA